MTGNPMAEDRIQLQTLTILALRGVLKSSALTGWHTATQRSMLMVVSVKIDVNMLQQSMDITILHNMSPNGQVPIRQLTLWNGSVLVTKVSASARLKMQIFVAVFILVYLHREHRFTIRQQDPGHRQKNVKDPTRSKTPTLKKTQTDGNYSASIFVVLCGSLKTFCTCLR